MRPAPRIAETTRMPRPGGAVLQAVGAAVLMASAAFARPPVPPQVPGPEAIAADPSANPEARVAAVNELLADPARDAIGRLVRLLGTPLPQEVRAATIRALIDRTGRDDLGANTEAWTSWWKEVSFLPEGEWRQRLAEAQSARAARLQVQRDAAIGRLGETLPRLHALTPPEERSDLIAGLILDQIPEVSRLGLDLASRALLNAQPLGDSVRQAALQRLAHPSPEIRAAGARLLEHLDPVEASEAAAAALAAEHDERAAQALLRLMTLQPQPSAVAPALAWLSRVGGARDGAADALVSMSESGMLSVRDRERTLAALRALAVDAWSPALVRLLGAIADADADLSLLVEITTTTVGAPRDAAMEALVASDAGLAMAEAAVRSRPALVEALARAVSVRRASAAGFWAFLRCAGEERLTHRSTPTALHALEPNDVEAAAMLFTDAVERDLFLTLWLNGAPGAAPHPDAARIWMSAARTRLALADGVGAIEALEQAGATGERARDWRAAALILSGCPDHAAQYSRDPELWLRTLESWGDRPGLDAACDGFIGALGSGSSDDQLDRLSRLLRQARAPSGAGAPTAPERVPGR